MFSIQFSKKPSGPTINATVRKAMAQHSHLVLTWGENQIVIEKTLHGWIGYGWIGKHSGHDLALKYRLA